MVKEFNGKNYSIPESWNDITVGMVINSQELSELLDDAPVIAILSAYTGIPVQQLKSGDVHKVNEILSVMDFISTPYEPQPRTDFEFNGSTYGCEDDLTKQRFEDFVSIQTCLYNFKDEPHKALPRLLAIYCKRENETLDDIDLNERTAEFNRLPITIARDIEAFFLHSLNAYNALLLLSSTQSQQEELLLAKVSELQNTLRASKAQTGMFSGTRFLIGLYLIYLKSVRKQLVRYFNSQPSKVSKNNWKSTFKKLLTRNNVKEDKSYIIN